MGGDARSAGEEQHVLELLSAFCCMFEKSKKKTYVALLDRSKRPD